MRENLLVLSGLRMCERPVKNLPFLHLEVSIIFSLVLIPGFLLSIFIGWMVVSALSLIQQTTSVQQVIIH